MVVKVFFLFIMLSVRADTGPVKAGRERRGAVFEYLGKILLNRGPIP